MVLSTGICGGGRRAAAMMTHKSGLQQSHTSTSKYLARRVSFHSGRRYVEIARHSTYEIT